jgi:hypothetical protein
MHINGLKELINLRGGIDTIKREDLRATITWYVSISASTKLQATLLNRIRVDLCGSYCQDVVPNFPPPPTWNLYEEPYNKHPPDSKNSSLLTAAFNQQMYHHPEIIRIFNDLRTCTSLTASESKSLGSDYWLKSTFAPHGAWTNVMIHRLLTLRPLSVVSTQEAVIAEVCRIGGLLYISPIWRKYGAGPAQTADLRRHLMATLDAYVVDWGELRPLLLWTMFLGCLEAAVEDERDWFLFRIAKLMGSLDMKWVDYVEAVKTVMWLDDVFAGTEDVIRAEIEDFLFRVSKVSLA